MDGKNYFNGVDDELMKLQNSLLLQIDAEAGTRSHFKRSMIRDAFMTINCAMESVNAVMNLDRK